MLSEKRAHFALVSLCLASRALVALDFGPVFYIWPATNMPYAGSFQNEEVCLPSMLHWVHPLRRESPGVLWAGTSYHSRISELESSRSRCLSASAHALQGSCCPCFSPTRVQTRAVSVPFPRWPL